MLNQLFTHPANKLPRQAAAAQHSAPTTLAQVSNGQQVTITGFDRLSPVNRQHLQAYGLLPGRTVRVLSQRPVTIVLVEQTELAFEAGIARQVLVEITA